MSALFDRVARCVRGYVPGEGIVSVSAVFGGKAGEVVKLGGAHTASARSLFSFSNCVLYSWISFRKFFTRRNAFSCLAGTSSRRAIVS